MKMSRMDIAYLIAPVLLWPIVFVLLRGIFVYAMLVAAVSLALFTLLRYRRYIKLSYNGGSYLSMIWLGILGSIALYLAFFIGYQLTVLLGLNGYVSLVYTMLYSQGSRILVAPILAIIGVSEEIYWRGGLQGYLRKNSRLFRKMPWLGSTLWYSAVHLLTFNPILALAAFFVGIITGIVAERYGIVASSIAHIAWLEAIILIIPIGA